VGPRSYPRAHSSTPVPSRPSRPHRAHAQSPAAGPLLLFGLFTGRGRRGGLHPSVDLRPTRVGPATKVASTDGVGTNGLPVEDERGRVGPESRKNLFAGRGSGPSSSLAILRLIMPCRSEGEGRLIAARGKPLVSSVVSSTALVGSA
jgi:hypothetical protein